MESTTLNPIEGENNSTKPILMDENGRNPDGTVKKGYILNPKGRPPKRRIEDYITEDDVVAIVEKAKEEAMNGKPDLLKELLGYMFGKPKQSTDITTNGKELNTLSYEQATAILERRIRGTESNSPE